MLRNIVQAFRAARAKPGYSVAVVAMLAVVVGANTAVFSIVNSVLLEPFPYDEEGRLVVMGVTQEQHADRGRLFAQW